MRYLLSFLFICSFVTISVGQNNPDSLKQNSSVAKGTGSVATFAQSDSINIKQMVDRQINAIKDKQLGKTRKQIIVTNLKNETTLSVTKKRLGNVWNDLVQNLITPLLAKIDNGFLNFNEISIKVKILGFASIISLLVVMIRRRIIKSKKKYSKRDGLKDNIRLLREERVVKKVDSKLKGIRNRLVNNTFSYSNTQAGISKVAKEMSIAKGEVLLAAKIKSYEFNKSWFGNIYKKMNWRFF